MRYKLLYNYRTNTLMISQRTTKCCVFIDHWDQKDEWDVPINYYRKVTLADVASKDDRLAALVDALMMPFTDMDGNPI